MTVTVPYTDILDIHRKVRHMSRAKRLEMVRALAEDERPLAATFTDSITEFAAGYANPYENFLPDSTRKPLPANPARLLNTDTVTAAIKLAGQLAIPGWSDFDVTYVERELSVMRTTAAAKWSDPTETGPAGRALLPDLLLANREDRTPAIGEIKVTKQGADQTDKDHYAALIQALAGAAHLATPAQYARLQRWLPYSFRTPEDSRYPRLDVYIISVAFSDEITDMEAILDATRRLSERLLRNDLVKRHLRRIVAVDLEPTTPLQPVLRFVAE